MRYWKPLLILAFVVIIAGFGCKKTKIISLEGIEVGEDGSEKIIKDATKPAELPPVVEQDLSLTIDDDGDGFAETGGDCNDADASIYPAAEDAEHDGIDQDCNGIFSYLPGHVSHVSRAYSADGGSAATIAMDLELIQDANLSLEASGPFEISLGTSRSVNVKVTYSYDEAKGELKREQILEGGTPLLRKYVFDSEHRLTELIDYSGAYEGEARRRAKISYREGEDIDRIEIYGGDGTMPEYEVYEYNDTTGKLSKKVHYVLKTDSSGEYRRSFDISYAYDEQGRVSTARHTEWLGGLVAAPRFNVMYSYVGESGKPSAAQKYKITSSGEERESYETYEYHGEDPFKVIRFDDDDRLIRQFLYADRQEVRLNWLDQIGKYILKDLQDLIPDS